MVKRSWVALSSGKTFSCSGLRWHLIWGRTSLMQHNVSVEPAAQPGSARIWSCSCRKALLAAFAIEPHEASFWANA